MPQTTLRNRIGQTGVVQFGYRAHALWTYRDDARRRPRDSLRFLLRDREISNFSYDLTNMEELQGFVAGVLERPQAEVDAAVAEVLGDRELLGGLAARLREHPRRNDAPRLGARPAWYAMVRLLRPAVVVETGIHDGLGSSVLLRALQRNAADGAPGRLLAFDIDPTSGWLVDDSLKGPLERHIGDARVTLPAALASERVDLMIHDSLHEYDHERFEYEAVLPRAADELTLMSDDAHATAALRDVCADRGVAYRSFTEETRNHFWPGGQLGVGRFTAASPPA